MLAACLLGVVGFAAAKWVVMPARAEYARNRAAIPARRAVIARYEAFRQGQDRVDEELFDQVERMEKWEDGLLVGETPSAAGVFLQGLLKPLTQRPETRVTSIRALPPVKKGRTPRWRCRWRSRPRRRGSPSCWPTSPGAEDPPGPETFRHHGDVLHGAVAAKRSRRRLDGGGRPLRGPPGREDRGRGGRVRRPALATVALSLLALLFGWETRQALAGDPRRAGQRGDGDGGGLAARGLRARPAAPSATRRRRRRPSRRARSFARTASRSGSRPVPVPPRGTTRRRCPASTLLGVLGFGDAPVGVVTRKTGNTDGPLGAQGGGCLAGVRGEGGADGWPAVDGGRAGVPSAALRRGADGRARGAPDGGDPPRRRASPAAPHRGSAAPPRPAPGLLRRPWRRPRPAASVAGRRRSLRRATSREDDERAMEDHEGTGRRRMKRMGWLFGGVIPAVVLLAASSVAAVEIAPLPHRAIDRIEEGVPAEPLPVRTGTARSHLPPPVTAREPRPAPGDPALPDRGAAARHHPPPPPAPAAPVATEPPSPTPRRSAGDRASRRRRPGRRSSLPLPSSPPAAPAFSPARPPSPAPSGAGPGFFVKFNNADIYEVIHTLGRTAGINYLIDPRVRGVVNVHTQGMVRKDGALDLLFSILKVNGATAVKEGDTYHIVPMTEAKTEPLMPAVPGDGRREGAGQPGGHARLPAAVHRRGGDGEGDPSVPDARRRGGGSGPREHPAGDRHDGEPGKDRAPGGIVRLRGVPRGGDEALPA